MSHGDPCDNYDGAFDPVGAAIERQRKRELAAREALRIAEEAEAPKWARDAIRKWLEKEQYYGD